MLIIRKGPYAGPQIIEMEDAEARRSIREEFKHVEPMGRGLVAWYNEAEKEGAAAFGITVYSTIIKGDVVITGINGAGLPASIPDVDIALGKIFKFCRYEQVDQENNVWRCRHCGHLEQFKALEEDGPFENGWNQCPSCGRWIMVPEE